MNDELKQKLKKIKALMFDKDGTLIDFDKTWKPVTLALALRAAQGDEEKAKSLLSLGGYDHAIEQFMSDSLLAAGSLSDIVQLWHPDLRGNDFQHEVDFYRNYCMQESKKYLCAIDGMETTLIKLVSLGYELGVGTNDSEIGAKSAMQQLGVEDSFELILGYDSVEHPKPAGDQIMAFAKYLGLASDEVAMIGDNGLDMEAARRGRAGLAIAVLSGNAHRDEFQENADLVLDSINDLPDLLARIHAD